MSCSYLLPFVQLFADVTSLIEVGETLRNGEESERQKQDVQCIQEGVCVGYKTETYYLLSVLL